MQGNFWDIRPLQGRTRTRIPKLTQIPKRRYTRRIQIPPPVYEYVDPFQSDYEIPDFTPEQKKKKRGYGTGYGFGDYIIESSQNLTTMMLSKFQIMTQMLFMEIIF